MGSPTTDLKLSYSLSTEHAGFDYLITLRFSIDGKEQVPLSALIRREHLSPTASADELKVWAPSVGDYLAREFPVRLRHLMRDLFSAANASTQGAPKAMAEHPADIQSRLAKRERTRKPPPRRGRPGRGKERSATRRRLDQEGQIVKAVFLADVRKYKEEFRQTHSEDRGIKTFVASKMYANHTNKLQELKRKCDAYGVGFQNI